MIFSKFIQIVIMLLDKCKVAMLVFVQWMAFKSTSEIVITLTLVRRKKH